MGKKNIKQNTLRDRADRLPIVTDEMWEEVCEENRFITDEYFASNQQLSPDSQKQYLSGLKQFFWWIRVRNKNKPLYEIKKRDFIKYRSFLINHGLSSSGINFKKAAVKFNL